MTAQPFRAEYEIRWSDLDANRHMKNYAYMQYAIHTRIKFFAMSGFAPDKFNDYQLGPVVFRDELKYYRELHLLDKITVDLCVGGLSADGVRFKLQNNIYQADGELSATVISEGGWLDLTTRKLRKPPEILEQALRGLPQTTDYAEIVRQSTAK